MRSAHPTRHPLGELVEVISGVVPAKPAEIPDGESFVGIAEITAGGAAVPRQVPAEEVPLHAPRLRAGDIAIALMSSIGSALLVTARHDGAVLGRECAALRPSSDEVTGPWLYVWTQSQDFADQVERYTTGGTMPRLSRRSLAAFTLPVPDAAAQGKVQDLLREFDEAIEKTGQVLADLTELRRTELQLLVAELLVGANK